MRSPDSGQPAVAPGRGAAARATPHARAFALGSIEKRGEHWEVLLVSQQDAGAWRGRVCFRTEGEDGPFEVTTTDIFVEKSESEIEARAHGLGQPLLQALLESALHTHERRQAMSEDVRQWFRKLLARNSSNLIGEARENTAELSLSRLRSLYDSYRLDQVGHLIALLRPDDFRACVERLLNGRTIDFRAGDRLQMAMIVVDELERRLPLPPFEVWVEDYLARPEEYHCYSESFHRGDALP